MRGCRQFVRFSTGNQVHHGRPKVRGINELVGRKTGRIFTHNIFHFLPLGSVQCKICLDSFEE